MHELEAYFDTLAARTIPNKLILRKSNTVYDASDPLAKSLCSRPFHLIPLTAPPEVQGGSIRKNILVICLLVTVRMFHNSKNFRETRNILTVTRVGIVYFELYKPVSHLTFGRCYY